MKGALETFWQWRERLEDHRTGQDFGITWDIETERLDPGSPTLCLSMAMGGPATVFAGNMLEMPEFLDRLQPGQLLIAHNMKYEAQSLIARGIDPRQFVWADTMLFEWVLVANNPRGLSLSLDATAQRYGMSAKDPYVDEMIKAGRVLEIEPAKLQERNRKDTDDTQAVLFKQVARMTEAQLRLAVVKCMTALELAYIEGIPSKQIGGMRLDPARVAEHCARNAAEIAEHEAALRDITRGANPKSVNEMAPVLYGIWPGTVKEADRVGVESLGFNEPAGTRTKASKPRKPLPPYKDGRPRSVKPVAWPDGKPSIAKETMALLAERARTPRQKTWAKHYLALMEAMAERDKNLTFYRGVVEQAGGVVYAELMQGITATHRLSCRSRLRVTVDGKEYGCQLQNTPRHLKGCFIAKRAGWLATSVDQSQAEFRGAIFLGDDTQGRYDIDNPRFDAHIQTLTVMLNGRYTQAAYDDLFDRYKAGDKQVHWQRADNKLCKGHCWTMDTAVLTPTGWRKYGELAVGDAVINYDQSSNTLLVDEVLDITAAHPREDVVRLANAHNWATTVTADHRLYGWQRRDRGKRGRVWEPAVALAGQVGSEFRICVAAVYASPGRGVTPDDAARLGWLCTDGRLAVLYGGSMRAIVIQKKPAGLSAIRKLFPPEFRTEVRVCGTQYIHLPAAYAWALCERAGINPMAQDWQAFVLRLSAPARAAWLNAVCLADGTKRPHGEWRLGQCSGPLADAMKLAAFLCGHDVRVTYATIQTGKQYEFITLRTRPYVNGTRLTATPLPRQDTWCLTTRRGTAVIRQGDCMMVTGQTFKPLFGGSSGTDTERAYYKWFGQHYAEVTATQNAWDAEVERTGRYLAPTGMQFHWDRTWTVNKWGRSSMVSAVSGRSLYSVVRNLPIQYLATGALAEVSTLCLLYEARRIGLRYECVMLIHDDTAGEVHPEDVDKYHATCGLAYGGLTWKFLFDVYSINYDVELAAESKAGVRFGEGEKQAHSYLSPINEDEQLMKISAKGSAGNRPPDVKAGTHIGIINAFIDLGVQPGSAAYPAPKRKVYVGVEFPNIIVEFKKDDVVEKAPARLGRFMAASMNEKATLRKFIESLLGQPFASDKAAGDYDVRGLLNKVGMFPVTHKLVTDRTYANLGNGTPLLEGMEFKGQLAKPALFYDTDAPNAQVLAVLPDWIKEILDKRVIPAQGAGNAPPANTGGLPEIAAE